MHCTARHIDKIYVAVAKHLKKEIETLWLQTVVVEKTQLIYFIFNIETFYFAKRHDYELCRERALVDGIRLIGTQYYDK